MRHFKKKTVAICLASALTVLGAFSAENYKNSLVSLKINKGSDGQVSLTAFTKKPLENPVMTEKIGEETFSIVLPETYSEIDKMPDLTGFDNIETLLISTHPYTPGKQGYTNIYLKTKGNPFISTNTSLYIEDKKDNQALQNNNSLSKPHNKTTSYWDKLESKKESTYAKKTSSPQKIIKDIEKNEQNDSIAQEQTITSKEEFPVNYNSTPQSSNERWAIIIGMFVVSLLIVFIYFMGKDKMASVIGEQTVIDLDDPEEDEKKEKLKKKEKTKKLKNTINKLDKIYKASQKTDFTQSFEPKSSQKDIPEPVIVDLDSLYSAKTQKNEDEINDENDDLANLLNDFLIQEEHIEEDKPLFDEELFEKIINNNKITFSDADLQKIYKLIQNEISDDAIENISGFISESKVSSKRLSTEVLESLLTEYRIKQNLTFTKDDVDSIKKLMNVELDPSFIEDLSTNAERTKEVEKELKRKQEETVKKHPEIKVLNVKEMLPDLSIELLKQDNSNIEPKTSQDVIYYSEGYDVSKLSVGEEFSDISKALKLDMEKPFHYIDNAHLDEDEEKFVYEIKTLSIKELYPELADVKASSLKEEQKETTKPEVNEEALLKSISNVTFKPFYEEEYIEKNVENTNNIIEEKEFIIEQPKDDKKEIVSKKTEKKVNDDAQKLIKMISEKQANSKNTEQQKVKVKPETHNKIPTRKDYNKKIDSNRTTCQIDGIDYTIVATANCDENKKCYLTKNTDGYTVIGCIDNKYKCLKHYDTLRSETIQARVNEKKSNGDMQYLVRTSIHKFVIDIINNEMEFVMDLC